MQFEALEEDCLVDPHGIQIEIFVPHHNIDALACLRVTHHQGLLVDGPVALLDVPFLADGQQDGGEAVGLLEVIFSDDLLESGICVVCARDGGDIFNWNEDGVSVED